MSVTAFHGLDAYSGKAGIHGLIAKARGAEVADPAEVCCSDYPVGTIGVLLHGTCRQFFAADAFTSRNHDGSRYAGREHVTAYERSWHELITGEEAPVYTAEYIASQESYGNYREILLTGTTTSAVWYTRHRDEKKARVLGRELGLPVVKVNSNSDFRSWQV